MCDPVTASLMIAGAGLSAAGSIGEAHAEARSLRQTASLREAEATRITQVGAMQAAAIRRKNSRMLGQQMVDFAAAGVDPTQGSALDVAQSSAMEGELEALSSLQQTAFDAEARRYEARGLRQRARSTKVGGYLTAGAKLLSAGGDIAALA